MLLPQRRPQQNHQKHKSLKCKNFTQSHRSIFKSATKVEEVHCILCFLTSQAFHFGILTDDWATLVVSWNLKRHNRAPFLWIRFLVLVRLSSFFSILISAHSVSQANTSVFETIQRLSTVWLYRSHVHRISVIFALHSCHLLKNKLIMASSLAQLIL